MPSHNLTPFLKLKIKLLYTFADECTDWMALLCVVCVLEGVQVVGWL